MQTPHFPTGRELLLCSLHCKQCDDKYKSQRALHSHQRWAIKYIPRVHIYICIAIWGSLSAEAFFAELETWTHTTHTQNGIYFTRVHARGHRVALGVCRKSFPARRVAQPPRHAATAGCSVPNATLTLNYLSLPRWDALHVHTTTHSSLSFRDSPLAAINVDVHNSMLVYKYIDI